MKNCTVNFHDPWYHLSDSEPWFENFSWSPMGSAMLLAVAMGPSSELTGNKSTIMDF